VQADQGTQADYFSWWPLVIDLSTASNEPGATLADVSAISLSTVPDSYGSGIMFFDDITASLAEPSGCNPADLAEPYGILDLTDINAFTAAFVAQDSDADLAAPVGIWDLQDILAFTGAFTAGCP
jgi:hypothetical protein